MKAESGEVEEREEKLSSLSLMLFSFALSLSFFPYFLTGPLPSERGTTLLGRARRFSGFQVPLTLAAPFEDQPEGSAEEKE